MQNIMRFANNSINLGSDGSLAGRRIRLAVELNLVYILESRFVIKADASQSLVPSLSRGLLGEFRNSLSFRPSTTIVNAYRTSYIVSFVAFLVNGRDVEILPNAIYTGYIGIKRRIYIK